MYFSPLSVTDDKQRDRNHQGNMGNRSYPGTVLGDVVGAAAWGSKIRRRSVEKGTNASASKRGAPRTEKSLND